MKDYEIRVPLVPMLQEVVSPEAERAADRWWDGARLKARFALINDDSVDTVQFGQRRDYINSPGWVPGRGERKMPSLWVIATYWAERNDWFDVNLDRPQCFACGLHGGHPEEETDPESRWLRAMRLERGHIVNRARHGLDGVQNLVPLCYYCNRFMPIFDVEHDEDATSWIFAGGAVGEIAARLEAQGLSWAEICLAWLEILDMRGGPALTDEEREAYERFCSRLLGNTA